MKTIREKSDALIDYLSDFKENGIVGYKVRLGDILERMHIFVDSQGDKTVSVSEECSQLLRLWNNFGFTKSLNEIFDSEFYGSKYESDLVHSSGHVIGSFKDENIQYLFDFLWELFGDKINEEK